MATSWNSSRFRQEVWWQHRPPCSEPGAVGAALETGPCPSTTVCRKPHPPLISMGPGDPERRMHPLHMSRNCTAWGGEAEAGQSGLQSGATPACTQPASLGSSCACSSQTPCKVAGSTIHFTKSQDSHGEVKDTVPGQAGEQQLQLAVELAWPGPPPCTQHPVPNSVAWGTAGSQWTWSSPSWACTRATAAISSNTALTAWS